MSVFSLPTIGALTGNAALDMRQMRKYMIQMNELLKYVLGNIGEENFTQEVRQTLYAGGVSGKVWAQELDTTIKALQDAQTRLATQEGAIRSLEGDVSLVQQTAQQLTSDVASAQGDISTLNQTASSLQTAIANGQGDLSTLQQTADSLQTAITDAEGDISTLQQTASSLTSSVSSLNGSVSSLRQQANGISSLVSDIDGRVSLLEQTATGVAIKLYDPSVSETYSVELSTKKVANAFFDYETSGGAVGGTTTVFGLTFKDGSSEQGYVGTAPAGMNIRSPRLEMHGTGSLLALLPYKAGIRADSVSNTYCFLSCHAVGSTPHIYRSKSLETYSDRRLKEQIQPIQGAEAFFDGLKPVQYVLTRQPSDGINYGFVAQDVEEALEAAGLDAGQMALISRPESNSGDMEGVYTLAYDHFIALCVAKIQAQQAQINELSARIARLEEKA